MRLKSRGSLNHAAKLNEEKVREMRFLRQRHGMIWKDLAAKYEVSKSACRQACGYASWIHVRD